MKKNYSLLLLVIISIVASLFCASYAAAAERNGEAILRAKTDLIEANASSSFAYASFTVPSLTASSLSYTAVGCESEIQLFQKNRRVKTFSFQDKLLSIQLSESYLYALFMKSDAQSPSYLRIYSLGNDAYSDYVFTGASFAKSIFLSGNKLYAFSSNYVHALSVESGTVTLEEELIRDGLIDRARKITGYKKAARDVLLVLSDDAVYKIENGQIALFFDSEPVFNVSASDKHIALLTADKIKVYDASLNFLWDKPINESQNDAQIGSASGVDIHADKLIVCDENAAAVKFFDIASGELVGMFAKSGSDDLFFNGAAQLCEDGKNLYVADSQNDRVKVYFDDMKFSRSVFVPSPRLVCAQNNLLYVKSDDGKIYVFENLALSYSFPVTGNVLSMCALDDVLYVLTDVSLTLYRQGETIESQGADGALLVHAAHVGSDVFAVKANKLVSLSSTLEFDLSSYAVRSVNGMISDYNGNLYLLCNRSFILKLRRTEQGYVGGETFYFDLDEASSLAINRKNGEIYLLSASQNNVYVYERSALSPTLKEDYASFAYPSLDFGLQNAALAVRENGVIQMYPDNYVNVTKAQYENVTLLAELDEHYYVEYEKGKTGFIKKSGATLLEKGAPLAPYTTICALSGREANVYRYPAAVETLDGQNNLIATISDKDACDVLSNAAQTAEGTHAPILGEYWFEIEFDGLKGYVQKSAVMPCDKPAPVEEKYYGIIKAKTIGSKVNCYATPDVTGAVALTLGDGEKVELAAPFDANEPFTKIIIDGSYYYVLSDNIILSGLTNGQLAAIIVVSVTLTAAILVLTITIIIIKKRKKVK